MSPEQYSLHRRLNQLEDDIHRIKRNIRSLMVFAVMILCVVLSPALIIPALISCIAWQLIDALCHRFQRKKREKYVFQQLSGRYPQQQNSANNIIHVVEP